MIVSQESIKEVAEQIAREFHPQKIILFGSYAYGTPRDDSDVDMLIVMPYEGNGLHKAVEIIQKVESRFLVDLLVRTPEQLRQRIEWNDFFHKEITEKGKVLYESANS
jgi:uncharacterized protein